MTSDVRWPRDLELVRADPGFTRAIGLRWTQGEPPSGYLDVPSLGDAGRDAWRATFDELRFFAETDDGDALALWLHEPTTPLASAPVVRLDTEGQLASLGATFADALVVLARSPEDVIGFFRERGVDVAPQRAIADGRVRFLPHPQDRHERRLDPRPRPVRTADPTELEHLVGMHARDPRVAEALAAIERAERPIQLWTDGVGRLTVLFLERDRLVSTSVRARSIALGDPLASLDVLGAPGRRGRGWATWDRDGVRMHVADREERVHMITLSSIDALPDHLR